MQQRDGALSALELMQPASLAEPAGAVVSHEQLHWGDGMVQYCSTMKAHRAAAGCDSESMM